MKVYGKSFAGEFRLYLKTFLFGETDPQLDGEIIFPREKPAPIETFPTAPRDAGKFRRIKICRVLWRSVHVPSASEKQDQAAATPTEGQKQRLIFSISVRVSLFSGFCDIWLTAGEGWCFERTNGATERDGGKRTLLPFSPLSHADPRVSSGLEKRERETRCSKTRASKIEGPWRGRGGSGICRAISSSHSFYVG